MNNKTILSISHSSYLNNIGGLEKVILEQYDVAKQNNYDFIAVFPISNNISFKGHIIKHKFQSFGVHINDKDYISMNLQELLLLLKKYSIEKVFIHSFISFPFEKIIFLLDTMLQVPLFFYVHDYKSVCVGHNLLKNKTRYCGSDGISLPKCFNCRFYIPGLISKKHYQVLFDHFSHMKFIFPSDAAMNVWKDSYRDINEDRMIVMPHQILSDKFKYYTRNSKLRLAYIGYKSYNKGWNTFCNLVRYINKKNINIDLFVLGNTDEYLPNVQVIEVSFQKEGTDAMTKAIRQNKIDIAFLWSPWPETYSYTFFESYVGGAFIITNINSGNIAVKTMQLNCGRVFSDEQELFKFFGSKENIEEITNYSARRPLNLTFNSEFINL